MEDSSRSTTLINNQTNYSIQILPYREGQIDNTLAKTILAQQTSEVFQLRKAGKSPGPSFAIHLQPYDSVVVVFNQQKSITHLKFNSIVDSSRRIPFNNNRSISNENNYSLKILTDDKHFMESQYTYSFTESDYQAAH